MIRGMSYKNGVFFMNHKGIAHASYHKDKALTYFQPISPQAFLFLFQRLMTSIPTYLIILGMVLSLLILRPDFIFEYIPFLSRFPEVPVYTIILLLFAYHFIFPMPLKKYHGAEHKVFSFKGRKHISQAKQIAAANIVNRNCSTNAVVLFFAFFLISFPLFGGWIATFIGWLAMLLIPRFWKWGDTHIFFPISAFLQKKITTAEPEEKHLQVAILSYMSLIAERALDEDQVWADYEKELEHNRIIRLIIEQERRQMEAEKWRDHYILNELARRERNQLMEQNSSGSSA